VESIAEYRSTIDALVPSCGHIAGECMIGGRPIATIALHQPLEVTLPSSGRVIRIPALELPCPKPGRAYATGWEHAEIAISTSIESPLNTQSVLREFMNQYPQVQWNVAALDKHCNADVSVSVTDQFVVKFHAVPLLQVVAFEIRNQSFEPVPEGYFN
jgi:predicted metalloenzyme YecM